MGPEVTSVWLLAVRQKSQLLFRISSSSCMSVPAAKYHVKEEIARGRSGTVELATTQRGSPVVLKKMRKGEVDQRWIVNEVRAGQMLKNVKGIVNIRDHFEDDTHSYLVADYVKGEDLFVFMQKREFKPLSEKHARRITQQLARTLESCHKKGIAHKDVKLENICLDKRHKPILIDFGFCEISVPNQPSTRWDGTPEYASPEVLLNLPFDTQKADVYSLGVVLFILLTGLFPFELKRRCRILQRGGKPKVDWNKDYYPPLSAKVKHLLDKMLEADPDKRINLQGVLNHPWFQKRELCVLL